MRYCTAAREENAVRNENPVVCLYLRGMTTQTAKRHQLNVLRSTLLSARTGGCTHASSAVHQHSCSVRQKVLILRAHSSLHTHMLKLEAAYIESEHICAWFQYLLLHFVLF